MTDSTIKIIKMYQKTNKKSSASRNISGRRFNLYCLDVFVTFAISSY